MALLTGFFVVLFIAVIFILLNPITTFIHELGHAIFALIFTKGNVQMFVGSYGDKKNSFKVKISRLTIFIKINLPHKLGGVCILEDQTTNFYQNIMILLAGSFLTAITAFLTFYLTFFYDWHGFIKVVSVIFLLFSVIELWINLVPNKIPIELHNGSITLNDGSQILQLWQIRKLESLHSIASKMIADKKYEEAEIYIERFIPKFNDDLSNDFYRYLIAVHIKTRDFAKAISYSEKLLQKYIPTSNDFYCLGLIYTHLSNSTEAIKNYDFALELQPENLLALNNKAYQYIILEKYEEALQILVQATELSAELPYLINSRGFAKIMLGYLEEGLIDIQYSLNLDNKNSYAYLHRGIYFLKKNDLVNAESNFKQAHLLDENTYNLDKYFLELNNLKNQSETGGKVFFQ
jgi:tetratricopeptide (TPR) repeat protein